MVFEFLLMICCHKEKIAHLIGTLQEIPQLEVHLLRELNLSFWDLKQVVQIPSPLLRLPPKLSANCSQLQFFGLLRSSMILSEFYVFSMLT